MIKKNNRNNFKNKLPFEGDRVWVLIDKGKRTVPSIFNSVKFYDANDISV